VIGHHSVALFIDSLLRNAVAQHNATQQYAVALVSRYEHSSGDAHSCEGTCALRCIALRIELNNFNKVQQN
jgi:hypothetical protein